MASGECNSAVQWDTCSTVVKKRSKGFQRTAFGVYSRTYIEGYLGTVWMWDVGGRWGDRVTFFLFLASSPFPGGKGWFGTLSGYLILLVYSKISPNFYPFVCFPLCALLSGFTSNDVGWIPS